MARWFLFFVIYSFFGYCLEKVFAYVTASPRQTRKCFLLLPLCPVYGLGMIAAIALAPTAENVFFLVFILGVVCTLAEYLVHLFYDRVFGVQFWDYSALRGNINGRVSPQFSAVWGILSALAVRYVHPAADHLVQRVSPAGAFFLWIVFAADCVLTASLLARYHDTERLSFAAFLSSGSPTNPERRGRRTGGSSH